MILFKSPTGLLRLACAFSLCLVISCTGQKGGTSGIGDTNYSAELYPVRIVDRSKFPARYRPAMSPPPRATLPERSSSIRRPGSFFWSRTTAGLADTEFPSERQGILGLERRRWRGWPDGPPGTRPTTCAVKCRTCPARSNRVHPIRWEHGLSISTMTGPTPSIASMGRLNLGQLVPRRLPGASAC